MPVPTGLVLFSALEGLSARQVVTVTWDPQPRASVRGSSPGGGCAHVSDLEQKGKTFCFRLLEFLLLWLVRDWLSLLSLVREAHPPYSLQLLSHVFDSAGSVGVIFVLTRVVVEGLDCTGELAAKAWTLEWLESTSLDGNP
ncbi:hypothetical protein Taro_041611, partial [Colocasia esculenta]|nr:hypothetical protein [Colocasia esculenta]